MRHLSDGKGSFRGSRVILCTVGRVHSFAAFLIPHRTLCMHLILISQLDPRAEHSLHGQKDNSTSKIRE